MKKQLFILFLIMHGFNTFAQEVIDTTDIVISRGKSDSYVPIWYHLKNQNSFDAKDRLASPYETHGEVSLSEDSRKTLSSIVHNSISTETLSVLHGKKIILNVGVNSSGSITNVMVGLRKEEADKVVFTKSECMQIIHDIKKDVKFDIVQAFENKSGHISMTVPIKIE